MNGLSIFDLFRKIERERGEKAPLGPPAWLIVGLGNPGDKYELTRHNAGFLALDTLAAQHQIRVQTLKFKALCGQGVIADTPVLLLKPQTFMNLSGEAVSAAAAFYKIPCERILVLFDDISLPPGKLRVRKKGSAGGHNGIKSIIAQCGSDAFPRIKIGVGAPPDPGYDVADWVLGKLSSDEQATLAAAIDRAVAAVPVLLRDGCEAAASRIN